MKQYAGYSVDFQAFWKYYNATVKKNYGNDYWKVFQNAFLAALNDEGYPNGLHSDTINFVWKHMTKLCNRATTIMKSNGVPATGCTSFTTNFKKWFKSYYNA